MKYLATNLSFKKKIDFVIFDLDDTLISEESWYIGKWQVCDTYLEKNYKIRGFYDIMKETINQKGLNYSQKVQDVLKQLDRNDLDIFEIVNFYRKTKVKPKVFPYVHQVLSSLKKMRRLGLITNGNEWEQKMKLEESGLKEYFNIVEYAEKNAKPNPEPYLNCLKRYNMMAENTIFVGNDPVIDFIGARKLGITTVRILHGLKKNVVAKKGYDADFSFKNLHEFYNEFEMNTI